MCVPWLRRINWFHPPWPSSSPLFLHPLPPCRGLVRTAVSPHPYPEGLHGRSGEPSQAVPDVRAPSGTCIQLAPVLDADSQKGHRLQPSSRCLLGTQHGAGWLKHILGDGRGLLSVGSFLKGFLEFWYQFSLSVINMSWTETAYEILRIYFCREVAKSLKCTFCSTVQRVSEAKFAHPVIILCPEVSTQAWWKERGSSLAERWDWQLGLTKGVCLQFPIYIAP